jgi:alpha-D-ribose 1-methylphosphonate 5-triphosphate diphosphatase
VRAVLPGAIIDNARVVVRDGLIAEVSAVPAGSGAGSAADLDGAGLLCVPGLSRLRVSGLATLPAAIGLVTSGAAASAGLSDRGRLTAGLRADLALVDDAGAWPVVRATFRAA